MSTRIVRGPYSMADVANCEVPQARRTGKRGKYGAIRTTVDGINFHSKREASRYKSLKFLESVKRIRNLQLQVKYEFVINGYKIGSYKADFVYEELEDGEWNPVVEDSKGYRTKDWIRTRKLMMACHQIEVRET